MKRRHWRLDAVTIVEMVVAAGVLVIFVAGAIAAMTQMNRYAASSRIQTLALAVAQQRIDEIRTIGWSVQPGRTRPALLAPTTPTDPPATLDPAGGIPVSLNDDPDNTTAASALDFAVNSRLYTFIRDVGNRSVSASVVIAYTYRARNYRIQLRILRTSDDF